MRRTHLAVTALTLAALGAAGCATKGTWPEVQTAASASCRQTRSRPRPRSASDERINVSAQGPEVSRPPGGARPRSPPASSPRQVPTRQCSRTTNPLRLQQDRLGDFAKAALDELAAKLKNENKPVYVEIGRTDSIGTDDYNFKLGEARAEAVRAT
jgi:outer membrane protein OmpA-like peptidoglycan-associated protein